jgi:MarR family transcriptional regulator, organic hydroperoxide resistance regulator
LSSTGEDPNEDCKPHLGIAANGRSLQASDRRVCNDGEPVNRSKRLASGAATAAILRHWREAVPNDRLAHLVKDATRALSRALQMRLTQYAVSYGHWTFLRILWETDGLTQRQLSEQAGVMEPTTFAALNALEKLGYITRRQRPDSRKKVYVFLTPKGRALKSKLVPLAEQVNEIAVRGAATPDIAATRRTLLIMIENLARDEIESEVQRRMPSTRELARLVAEARSNGRTRGRRRVAE